MTYAYIQKLGRHALNGHSHSYSYSRMETEILDEVVQGIARAFRTGGSGTPFEHDLAGRFQLFLRTDDDVEPQLELVSDRYFMDRLIVAVQQELNGDLRRMIEARRCAKAISKALPAAPAATVGRRRL